eukprot:2838199-Alexandrium_andersonii.AAC.1
MRVRELEEDSKVCSLGQLLPGDPRRALGGKLELQTCFRAPPVLKRRLGLEKRRALPQEATSDASVSMDIGALAPGNSGGAGVSPDFKEHEAAFALLRRALQPNEGEGKGGKADICEQ